MVKTNQRTTLKRKNNYKLIKTRKPLKLKKHLKNAKTTPKNKNSVSTVYNMELDTFVETNKTYHGNPFFKKIYPIKSARDMEEVRQTKLAETTIAKKLMNPSYKHPNIVHFFDVKKRYILMEKLKQLDSEDTIKNAHVLIESMRKTKDFLQSLGIIYVDWKFDNIGKNKKNVYKLFDFDASGIIDLNTNEWIIEPPNYLSYKTSKERKCKTPQEIDNWSFEYNLMNNSNVTC